MRRRLMQKFKTKINFRTTLTELIENISDRKDILLIGDLNARTCYAENSPVVGGHE